MSCTTISRRGLIAAAGAALIVPATARASEGFSRHNTSSFVAQDWRAHFSELGKGAIVVVTGKDDHGHAVNARYVIE